jgi:hypothetical protein
LAAESVFSTNSTFFNCNDTSVSFNITASAGVGPITGTILFIIDNSGLFPNASFNASEINLILSNEVIANVNE